MISSWMRTSWFTYGLGLLSEIPDLQMTVLATEFLWHCTSLVRIEHRWWSACFYRSLMWRSTNKIAMHARYVARYLTPPQHLTYAVITVGHFVRRVGSRLQRSVGEEDDAGHSAGVKKKKEKKRRTTLMHSNPTPAVSITFSNPSSFQAVKEGNWMVHLMDGVDASFGIWRQNM